MKKNKNYLKNSANITNMWGHNTDVAIIGIDPAPAKKTVICTNFKDGECYPVPRFDEWEANQVKKELTKWRKAAEGAGKRILVTWDAPLTGPASLGGIDGWDSDFTKRIIESFFTSGTTNEFNVKKYKGKVNGAPDNEREKKMYAVSVQGYSTCPHWVISKSVLDLPAITKGEPDSFLPLAICKEPKHTSWEPASYEKFDSALVAEVHPALAMWLMLGNEFEQIFSKPQLSEDKKNQVYKGNPANCAELFTAIADIIKNVGIEAPDWHEIVKDKNSPDDHLDAWVAWLLGKLWVDGKCGVQLVGTLATGAMLLPRAKEVAKELKLFEQKIKKSDR